ncbi:MAG: DUF4238 domain-containing protein [Lactobacillaceae bacterium]|jgi:hypothetical protein|nr:DUF4238 domain-containing protein [Lactobacillaceae bacterium]
MAEKVKQHYVPQFYLKRFMNDENRIWQYNKSNGSDVNMIPKNIAHQRNLYGKDSFLENILSEMENKFAFAIKNVAEQIQEDKLFLSVEDKANLLGFASIQLSRSKSHNDLLINVNNMGEEKFKKRIIPEINGSLMNSSILVGGIQGMTFSDLEVIGIKHNLRSAQFIASDNPVIPTNQAAAIKKVQVTGHNAVGFMVYFPISAMHAIILYDRSVYSFENTKNNIVKLISVNDVNALNKLSIAYSDLFIFHQNKLKENEKRQIENMGSVIETTINPDTEYKGQKRILVKLPFLNRIMKIPYMKIRNNPYGKIKQQINRPQQSQLQSDAILMADELVKKAKIELEKQNEN